MDKPKEFYIDIENPRDNQFYPDIKDYDATDTEHVGYLHVIEKGAYDELMKVSMRSWEVAREIELADKLVGDYCVLQDQRDKAIQIAKDMLEMVQHCGDFRNGITHGGYDEGDVLAGEFFNEIKQRIKDLETKDATKKAD